MNNFNWLERVIIAFAVILITYGLFVIGGGIGEFNDWFSNADKTEAVYIIAVGVGGVIIGVFMIALVRLLMDSRNNVGIQRNIQITLKHFIEDYKASTLNPEQLKKYKSLLADGVITEEEFNKKKKELM